MNTLNRLVLLALVVLFVACGGGSDTSLTQTDGGGSGVEGDVSNSGSADGTDGENVADAVTEPDGGPVGECWEGIKLCEGDGVKRCVDGAWTEVEACDSGLCQGGECVDCVPNCGAAECGPDGCGGSCGACDNGAACEEGQCACVPDCDGMLCGPDGCGASCGACGTGQACTEGQCTCAPDCGGKECGPDGCGGHCGACQGDMECGAAGACLATGYRAVLIQDHWSTGCSNYNSTGADIDAVGLYDAGGELVSYFVEVIGEVGTEECTNSYADLDEVIGEKDGTAEGCVALQGGWIMGRFADDTPITAGMSVTVYEYGNNQGGSSEPFSVYLTTGFGCADSADPGACALLLSDEGYGPTEFIVP